MRCLSDRKLVTQTVSHLTHISMSLPFATNINQLLNELVTNLKRTLGDKVVGFYVYGSLTAEDFDKDISDIDLLVVTRLDIKESEFNELNKIHISTIKKNLEWDDRLEIAYISVGSLEAYRRTSPQIAVIGPGQPFNIKKMTKDWLINWWMVRNHGIAIFGPDPKEIIPAISKKEFVACVKEDALEVDRWMSQTDTLPSQSFTILTLSRSLYSFKTGEYVSKRKAIDWIQVKYPQWISLTEKAYNWRSCWKNSEAEPESSRAEVREYVKFIAKEITEA